jgi:ribose transport system substrate-binding protein
MDDARHGGRLRGLAPALVAALLIGGSPAAAQDIPAGITVPRVLAPFDPDAAVCTPPPGLRRALGFAQDNSRAFIEGVGQGLAAAADDRGLVYEARVADSDPAQQQADIAAFRAAGFGAVVTPPVDPASLAPALEAFIAAGGYVGTVVPPPAVTILNAPQYLTGKVLAEEAAEYIRDALGGTANVVLLTQDSMQFLAPRFVALRDVLAPLPGVTIVADISPNPVNEQGGYETMKLILGTGTRVDVVLGADAVVLGALKALREAGKDRPDQFLGGIDGEQAAVEEIKAGGGPYKASVALSSPVFGYALGMFAADWLEGRSVPQGLDVLPFALTRENLPQYEADQADPGAVYADPVRRDAYLRMYGNICYDSRGEYLNFPWSSEAE